jgi:glutathione peroxidase
MNQEPGTSAEIKQFCTEKYGVTFPVFEKISVKGKDIHPLYKWLTDKEIHPEYGGEITWNFNKFLISKEGKIINRFDSKIKPEDPNLVMMIEAALREKPAEK